MKAKKEVGDSVQPAGLPGDLLEDRNNISSVQMAPEIPGDIAEIEGQKEEELNLTRQIKNNAFTGAIVYALQREGKSSYAMQTMHELYGNWDDVFKNMFFRLEDITDYLFDHLNDAEPLPCVMWDDAGVHANKLLYFKDSDQADLIKRLFDVIGIATKGIILTTPVPDDLLRSLRNYEFFKIKIMRGRNEYDRTARAYKNILWPSGKHINPTAFEDHFDVRLPDEIYEKYTPIRRGYYIESLHNLREFIKNRKLEACMKEKELKRLEKDIMIYA